MSHHSEVLYPLYPLMSRDRRQPLCAFFVKKKKRSDPPGCTDTDHSSIKRWVTALCLTGHRPHSNTHKKTILDNACRDSLRMYDTSSASLCNQCTVHDTDEKNGETVPTYKAVALNYTHLISTTTRDFDNDQTLRPFCLIQPSATKGARFSRPSIRACWDVKSSKTTGH